MTRRSAGFLLILISAASFGCLAIFARFAYRAGIEPMTVLFLRFAMAALIMVAISIYRRKPVPRGRKLAELMAMGGIGYVGQSICFFTALTMASAGLVELLLYLYPALVTILAILFLRERLTRTKLIALFIALCGLVLTIGPVGSGHPLGIALGIGSGVIYAIYIVVGSRITREVDPIVASTVIIATASLVYAVIAGFRGVVLPTSIAGWEAILGLAVVATVIAIITFFAGLERIGPTDTAMLATVEPAVTLTLAATLLGEPVRPMQLAGGALILAAVLMLGKANSESKSEG